MNNYQKIQRDLKANPDRNSNIIIRRAVKSGFCGNCGNEFGVGDMFKWHRAQFKGYCVACPATPNESIINQHSVMLNVQNKNSGLTHESQYSTREYVERQDIADVAVKKIDVPYILVKDMTELFDGRFTIPYTLRTSHVKDQARERHITLWISTRSKKSHYAGQRRIRVFHGRDNNKEYIDIAYIKLNGEVVFVESFFQNPSVSQLKMEVAKQAVAMLVGGKNDLLEFAMEYALLSRRCWRCHRVLTNPTTLKLESGCGPVCNKFYEKHNIDPSNLPTPQTRVISI